jgi:hypothetical protein
MVVKSVYTRAEKIHSPLFFVYNRLRGGLFPRHDLFEISLYPALTTSKYTV